MILAAGVAFLFFILLFTVSICVAVFGELYTAILDSNRRRRLNRKTKSARIRDVYGKVVDKQYHGGHYDVTVLIGKKTYLTADDEDAYFVLKRGEKVVVRVREHINSNNKIFHRALLYIELSPK